MAGHRMAVKVTCPNCGHQFVRPSMANSALEGYHAVGKDGTFPKRKAYSEATGMPDATVFLNWRLGVALVECGVREDSDLFRALGQHANDREVKEVIGRRGTPVEIAAAVEQTRVRKGR